MCSTRWRRGSASPRPDPREVGDGQTLTQIAKAEGVTRAQLIATIRAALRAEGVPAARTAALAAHIADHTRPEGGPGGHGPRGARP